jgi:hypothetical protein
MERRDRNQVVVEAKRIETMGGMIGNLIASGGRIQDNPLLKGDHGQSKCQALQLIRVFGTDRESSSKNCTGSVDDGASRYIAPLKTVS